MTDMTIDTHAFVETLTAAGMPEAQAEAVTTVVRQSHEVWLAKLVTKADLDEAEAKVKSQIGETEAKLGSQIGETEARLTVALAETKAEIMKWMIGTVGGAVVINAMTIIGAMLALTKMNGH